MLERILEERDGKDLKIFSFIFSLLKVGRGY